MKMTILGCGSAGGVPLIGNNWGDCDPAEPRNRRTRPSALVEEGETTLLIDTSPDMRQQLLACNLKRLTAVLYTHAHADHVHGIDDLRSVNWMTRKTIPIYAQEPVLADIRERFRYIFDAPVRESQFYRPSLEVHELNGPFTIGSVRVTSIAQSHGHGRSTGFRFNDLAYTTDVSAMPESSFEILQGVKVWVVGCIRERPHPSHAALQEILSWIDRVGPRQAYLTHMDQSMDYARLAAKLPPNVAPAYDGLVVEC